MKRLFILSLAALLALTVSCKKNDASGLPVPQDGYVTVDGTKYKIVSVSLYDNYLPPAANNSEMKYKFDIRTEGFDLVMDCELEVPLLEESRIDLTQANKGWSFKFYKDKEDLLIGKDAMEGSYFKFEKVDDNQYTRPFRLELSAVSGGHRFSLKYSGPTVPVPTIFDLYYNGTYYKRLSGAGSHTYDAAKLAKGIYDLTMEAQDGHALHIVLDAGHDGEWIDLSKLDPYMGQSGKQTYSTSIRVSADSWRVLSYGHSAPHLAEPGSFLKVIKTEYDGQIVFQYMLFLCRDNARVGAQNLIQPFQPK